MSEYRFSPTLLDRYENYINSSRIYQEYWGFSEEPSKTEEEFEKEQFQGLIDTINRVPFESEASDKGTAFNEVIDCIIEDRKSTTMEISVIADHTSMTSVEPNSGEVNFSQKKFIRVFYKHHTFLFPLNICVEVAKYLSGALTQQWVNGVLETTKGKVHFVGCIDQLLPFKVCDTKTLSKYSAFKFRHNWQHVVYPFCLNQNGIYINDFEYVITDFKSTWTEHYVYNESKDVPRLNEHCEGLIDFIELNRHLITDTRIFNQ
ncbi:hypothetical protein [Flavobacterium sp.]|uniref:hypothetical protein n=1 Tax=Flavobacterium sp. TaxID=239 RepID=UPI0022BF7377|nr:hypothetical protein [Flavobacterium sp.]MCZ8144891.1 hypothetical protein [Flavobacterium sp.]